MTTRPEADVMAGIEPEVFVEREYDAERDVVTHHYRHREDLKGTDQFLLPIYTSTQINEQFAKVLAEKDAELEAAKQKAALWDSLNMLWSYPGQTLQGVLTKLLREMENGNS